MYALGQRVVSLAAKKRAQLRKLKQQPSRLHHTSYTHRRLIPTNPKHSILGSVLSKTKHHGLTLQQPQSNTYPKFYSTEFKEVQEEGDDFKAKQAMKDLKDEMPDLEVPADAAAKAAEPESTPVTPSKEESSASKEKETLIEETEIATGSESKHEFQAETKKILDIVARSLYSEREIFIRELVSNGSDALEKLRQKQVLDEKMEDPDLPLEISISVDDKKNVITIMDTGIGMSKDELVDNLGKIGHSGTAEFLKAVEGHKTDSANLIGQFGVGFYSCFMAGEHVKVYSKSCKPGSKGYYWSSDGSGSYTIQEAQGVQRGTKIIIQLRENSREFSKKLTVENIIKKYSNFVGFPIKVNGNVINTVAALWLQPADKVTPEQHKEFYQFIAHAYDSPLYTLMYRADSPITIRALFYFPEQHMEKYGMGKMDPGVSLFSRKVLIQGKCKGLLPDWLRFVKGVVDSEDLPLNLSREFLQDSALVKRLNNVLTRRILKFLADQAKSDRKKFEKWFGEYGHFLKEGICTDVKWKEDIARLLRMESSKVKAGSFTSLDGYIKRMKDDQKDIFYLTVPNRAVAESSPYFEAFRDRDIEVLFLYRDMDDFVMSNLSEYMNYKLQTIESANAGELVKGDAKDKKEDTKEMEDNMNEETFNVFSKWLKDTLKERITNITRTDRLTSTPMIVVDHESASFRRMMQMVDPERAPQLPKQQVQVNPKHPIMIRLNNLRDSNPDLASDIANQVMDHALIQAGIMDDPRTMVPRMNKLLERIAGTQ